MRRPGLALGAVLLVGAGVALAPLLALLRRSWPWRIAVEGHSMEPTLRAGDWLLVDPSAFHSRSPLTGELVVAVDPRLLTTRWLVKRVSRTLPDGRFLLAGDHPAHRLGDAELEALAAGRLIGRPWLRYWPLGRFGRVA